MRALLVVAVLVSGSVGSCGPASRPEPPRGAATATAVPDSSKEAESKLLEEIDSVGPTAPGNPAGLRLLGHWIQDPRRPIASRAAEWLGKAGRNAVPTLVRALGDTASQTRIMAAYGLGLIGAEAGNSLPALTRELGGADDSIAGMSDWAINQIQPHGSPFIALLRGLRYGNSFERGEAARTLSIYGEAMVDAVPLLVRALQDEDPLVVRAAGDALVAVGPVAVPTVKGLLKSENPNLRYRGILLLNRMQPSAF